MDLLLGGARQDWIMPILDAMVAEQKKDGVVWTPSKTIHRLGREINNPESVWCVDPACVTRDTMTVVAA